MINKKINVNIFLRNPNKLGNFSLEIFYNELLSELNKKINVKIKIVPFKNKGVIGRIVNIIYCWSNQADINHIVGDISYCSLLMKKKKLVITILDCISMYGDNNFKKYLLRYFLFLMPVNKAKKIIVISESTKKDLEKLLNKKLYNCNVIPVTVSSSFFTNKLISNKSNLSKRYLMIGTAPNKNIERVSQALETLNGELHIVGKLNQSQIDQLIKSKINYVEYAYPLTENEIMNQYRLADILLFPSTLEGFGMPIIEANLMSVPVLTSNISSMPYVAGKSAILVDPFNYKSIRKGINSILTENSLKKKLVFEGTKNAQRFTIDKISTMHLNLYKEI